MASDIGWLKLHRKFIESDVFQHPGMWHLFCYCMARANVADKPALIPGTTEFVTIKRGQFITGRNSLHAALYPNAERDTPVPRTVWRWMETIQGLGCIKLETLSNRCTLVSVCNYETYQARETGQCPAHVPLVSSTCPADVPHVSTVEEFNNQRIVTLSGFSTEGCNDAIVTIHDAEFGETFRYEQNTLRWHWLFIERWNGLPGDVVKHSSSDLAPFEVRLLRERFQEFDWLWKDAFQCFPVNFPRLSLGRFLKDNLAQEVNGGSYKIPQFVEDKGNRNGKQKSIAGGNGVTYSETARERNPNYGKFPGMSGSAD